jgi:RNA polymerase sigma factor (sigma-70 family)
MEGEMYKKLTREEEVEIFTHLTRENKQFLVENSQFYVIKMATGYIKFMPGFDINDLIQEASIGVIKAIDRFKLDRKVTFLTYATYYIRLYMLKFFRKEVKYQKRLRKIRMSYHNYIKSEEGNIDNENQLEKLMCCLTKRNRKVMRLRFGLDEEKKTLREVGKILSISKERTRQLQNKGLLDMRACAKRLN